MKSGTVHLALPGIWDGHRLEREGNMRKPGGTDCAVAVDGNQLSVGLACGNLRK